MKYRTLGRTGLEVSEVGHGLWGMGGWSGSDREESLNALRIAVEQGVTFFDTAWAYGEGFSDALAGELVREFPNKSLIVASKIPPKNRKWPGTSANTLEEVFPHDHVMEYTQKILEVSKLNRIDVLQFHVWDDSWTAQDEWKTTVEDLKRQGLIRAFGLSINRWEAMNGAEALRTGVVDAVQVIYNIFDQAPEDELFPLCEELNIGVIARVPFDEGGLTGNLTKETRFPPDDWRARYFGPENLSPTVDHAEALKAELPEGMGLPELALRFILSNPTVSTTIAGMRKRAHVEANASYSDGQGLPTALIERLRAHRWDRQPAPWSD